MHVIFPIGLNFQILSLLLSEIEILYLGEKITFPDVSMLCWHFKNCLQALFYIICTFPTKYSFAAII